MVGAVLCLNCALVVRCPGAPLFHSPSASLASFSFPSPACSDGGLWAAALRAHGNYGEHAAVPPAAHPHPQASRRGGGGGGLAGWGAGGGSGPSLPSCMLLPSLPAPIACGARPLSHPLHAAPGLTACLPLPLPACLPAAGRWPTMCCREDWGATPTATLLARGQTCSSLCGTCTGELSWRRGELAAGCIRVSYWG